jgi:hypothetical protein
MRRTAMKSDGGERMSEDVALVREACDDRDQCDAIDQSKGAFPRHYVAAFDRILASLERKPLDDCATLALHDLGTLKVDANDAVLLRECIAVIIAYIESLEADLDALVGALADLVVWADCYPVAIFGDPDLAKAHKALKAEGMTLDSISAHVMRRTLADVKERAQAAIARVKGRAK